MTRESNPVSLALTMSEEIEPKSYELAYHLNPDLEEAGLGNHVKELSELITQNSGSLLTSREPKRIHLSYPIHRKQYAYFGVFDFTASPETIEKVNAQMKLQNNVLRYLLVKKYPDGKEVRTLGEYRVPRPKVKIPESVISKKKLTGREEKSKEPVKPEEIEKEIEKVIEGL